MERTKQSAKRTRATCMSSTPPPQAQQQTSAIYPWRVRQHTLPPSTWAPLHWSTCCSTWRGHGRCWGHHPRSWTVIRPRRAGWCDRWSGLPTLDGWLAAEEQQPHAEDPPSHHWRLHWQKLRATASSRADSTIAPTRKGAYGNRHFNRGGSSLAQQTFVWSSRERRVRLSPRGLFSIHCSIHLNSLFLCFIFMPCVDFRLTSDSFHTRDGVN